MDKGRNERKNKQTRRQKKKETKKEPSQLYTKQVLVERKMIKKECGRLKEKEK